MIYRADLHLHTDIGHGDTPGHIADGIVTAHLDAFALTNHQRVSPDFFAIQEEIGRLTEGTGRSIFGILGAEIATVFEGQRIHLNYLFEETFGRTDLPEIPPAPCDIREIEELKKAHPGVITLDHPIKKSTDVEPRRIETLVTLIHHLKIEALEVLNGSVLNNGTSPDLLVATIRLFQRLRASGLKVSSAGNSDAHRGAHTMGDPFNMVGSAVTEFGARSPERIFDALRRGDTCAIPIRHAVQRKVRTALDNYRPKNGIHRHVRG